MEMHMGMAFLALWRSQAAAAAVIIWKKCMPAVTRCAHHMALFER